jgi:hypothetical protein
VAWRKVLEVLEKPERFWTAEQKVGGRVKREELSEPGEGGARVEVVGTPPKAPGQKARWRARTTGERMAGWKKADRA